MNIKLIADSSANICQNITLPISYVPLKIVTARREYVDTPDLDVPRMLSELKQYKGTSGTACPGIQDWLDAFDGADMILGVSLTSALSGCYNSGVIAMQTYLEQKPDAKIFLLDSLSTGPELELLPEKYQKLFQKGLSFQEICDEPRTAACRRDLKSDRFARCCQNMGAPGKIWKFFLDNAQGSMV